MNRIIAESIFHIARFTSLEFKEIPNEYWPKNEKWDEVRAGSPWWNVTTEYGPVVIGWKNTEIHIGWSQTKVRAILTPGEVDPTSAAVPDAIEAAKCLTQFRRAAILAERGEAHRTQEVLATPMVYGPMGDPPTSSST